MAILRSRAYDDAAFPQNVYFDGGTLVRAQQGSNGAAASPVEKSATKIGHTAGKAHASRLRVLAVLDGSQHSEAVIDYLLDLAKRGTQLEVVLLNIQPRPTAWQTRGVADGSPRERLGNYRGKRVVHSVRQRLDSAGIPATERVEFGDEASTIVHCATETSSDQIVMPALPAGPTRRWLARHARISVANAAAEVAHLSPIPVVIVGRRTTARNGAH